MKVYRNIVDNGLGIAEGGEIKEQMLSSAPQLAKPFFCLLIYIFEANKKWFLRNCSTKVEY